MFISKIKKIIEEALKENNIVQCNNFTIEKARDSHYGDFSTNVALIAAKSAHLKPMELGEKLVQKLSQSPLFAKVTCTPPGFINFFLTPATNGELIKTIIQEGDNFGKSPIVSDDVYSVEYVSANPTGYLHVGHARNAVLGNCIVNLLTWCGKKVVSEYVVNDAGNQMNKLAAAVLIRYLQLFNQSIELPEDSYHGQEIILVAQALKEKYGDKFVATKINEHELIDNKDDEFTIRWFARDFLLDIIKKDLKDLGVEIQYYYSEYETHKNNLISTMIDELKEKGMVYEKDGAIWLKTTLYNDDKDRVLIKSDGVPTYFAPDIYYHDYKLKTHGTKYVINIWGADHYSYIVRMRAALLALGYQDEQFKVICMQMVRLLKDGKEFKMSKRTGNSLTCRDLIDTLSKDVARWFLVSQSANSHIEIDVDVATKKDNSNPYFYVQYAHARGTALLKKEKIDMPTNDFQYLISDVEREIINELHYFQYTIQNAASTYEPYKLSVYLINLAKLFHNFYTNTKILDANNPAQKEQIALVKAVCQVIKNALAILGIEALERM